MKSFHDSDHYFLEIPDSDCCVLHRNDVFKLQCLAECSYDLKFRAEFRSKGTDFVVVETEVYEQLLDDSPEQCLLFYLRATKRDSKTKVFATARFSTLPCEPFCTVYAGAVLGGGCVKSMKSTEQEVRRQLETDGKIADGRLVRTHTFENYSVAASVLQGASVSGNEAWKDIEGKSLGDRGWGVHR